MKKIFVIALAILAVSCQNEQQKSLDELMQGKDVDALRAKQLNIQAQTDSLKSLSDQLTERIAELDPQAARLVKFIQAKDTIYKHFIKLQANIETDQDVQVSPEFAGVISLKVREGQYVRRGQLIATISDGGLSDQVNQAKIGVDQAQAALQQAEIARDLAKTTFERQQTLWNQNIGSEMQYLQAKTNYETAQKQVSAARSQVSAAQRGVSGSQAQLAKTRLTAPFSGRVEQVITQNGQAVAPGVPVIRLVNPATVKAIADVPETYLPKVKTGTSAVVFLPSLDKKVDSKVSLVSAAVNPANRTFKVEVPVPDKNGLVKPNLNAEILLNDYVADSVYVLKKNTVRMDSKGKYVFIAQNIKDGEGTVKRQYIETGYSDNGVVEVTSGLKNGEYIITESGARLLEGDKVKLTK